MLGRRGSLTACVLGAIVASGLLVGCSGAPAGRETFEPITVKEPPSPDGGTQTVAACEGVVERGECDDHAAVSCDLEREEIRRVDCAALGQTCLVDTSRGAVCAGSTNDDYDAEGECESGAALWKDADGQLQRWNCADDGLTCQVDACESGAYCCSDADGSTPPTTDPCKDILCDEETAHLSSCCDAAPDECEELGSAGVCTTEGKVRYCKNGEIIEYGCSEGAACEVGTCFSDGAECCGGSEPANECEELGLFGECSGQTVRWCSAGQIVETDCSKTGKTCQVDACGFGADCCPPTCEDVGGTTGSCQGGTLRYCNGNGEVVQTDCTALGKTCQVDSCLAGLAECCA